MKKDSEQFFQELKRDITTFAELKVELLKLTTFEKTGKVISVLAFGLLIVSLIFSLILFIFIALGSFLSEWLGSYGMGFSAVVILYLLLIGITLLFKNEIQLLILNMVIDACMDNDNKENNDDTTTATDTNTTGKTSA
ncbi:MAG: hypothetical protein LBH90_01505 [Tannerella sp.]|jgi:hypothetical protein|nr:hypothetical protein [Tannerella sp.]